VTPDPVPLAALRDIYERSYARLLRVAEATVGDVDLARAVVQEAFARLIKSRSQFRGEGSLDGWVWRTVVNTARNARRDAFGELVVEPMVEQTSSNGQMPNADLRSLLAALPERQRLVLFLRYYADLDYRAIAEVLEIESGTVGATLNQAHAAMRRLLEEAPR